MDATTGTLYIGTERGLMSYQGDAPAGGFTHGEVIVYPNPVRPEYNGNIVVAGLAQNALVKITDINGNLIYEANASGSQLVWDGRNAEAKEVSSGVYLVFSSNSDGSDSVVTKLLVVR